MKERSVENFAEGRVVFERECGQNGAENGGKFQMSKTSMGLGRDHGKIADTLGIQVTLKESNLRSGLHEVVKGCNAHSYPSTSTQFLPHSLGRSINSAFTPSFLSFTS